MLLNLDALQRDTFDVGIALLTVVNLSTDDDVTVRNGQNLSCMSCPYYIRCTVFACLNSNLQNISIKSSKTAIRENLDPRKFSAIQ